MSPHFVFLLSIVGLLSAGPSPEVHLPGLGALQGSLGSSRRGREFYSFTSVPYAKPPLGELRFQSPHPAEKWDGVLDASGESSPMCLQIPFFIPALKNMTLGQEDCLYLNVFTPKIDKTAKMPVMVFIHGGGFRCGDPGPKGRAQFLMDQDVVLVKMTYRLGPLGFLSTEDEVIPGNFGLKDQAMALKWIKQNIEHFGGDPNSITIFGESAGGASVHFLMMSPLSKDLIKGAISESGTATALWAVSPKGTARDKAHQVAKSFNCPIKKHKDMLECLLRIDATALTEAERIFNVIDFDPAIVFQPVIESKKVKDAFITFDPETAETTLPWIQGMTSSEGSLKTASLLSGKPEEMQDFINRFEELLPEVLMYRGKVKEEQDMTLRLKSRYFSSGKPTLDEISSIFSDGCFLWPSGLASKNHKGPQWFYYFDHRGERSLTEIFGDVGNLGVSHGDELLYLFNFQDMLRSFKESEQDALISERMVKLWVDFAKFGNPTPGNGEVKWKQYGKEREYLHMKTKEFTMDKHLQEDNIAFWNTLPLYANKKIGKDEL